MKLREAMKEARLSRRRQPKPSSTKPIIAADILEERHLSIGFSAFECPYCWRRWSRGGSKEGFVKSGASNHVALCYEIVLFRMGFILGPYAGNLGRSAIPITEASEPWHKRNIRAIKAGVRSREKQGLRPRVPIGDRPAPPASVGGGGRFK